MTTDINPTECPEPTITTRTAELAPKALPLARALEALEPEATLRRGWGIWIVFAGVSGSCDRIGVGQTVADAICAALVSCAESERRGARRAS